MKPAFVIVALCLVLIAGCAVGPDYQPPKVNTPSNWTTSLTDGETNGPPKLAAWWKNFSDTNLDALMTVAVQSNLTLRIAEAHVRESRAQRGVVAADLWPNIDSSASYPKTVMDRTHFHPSLALAFR